MQHRRIALLELMQKHIRKRDLMGLMEQLVALLVKGYANDSQLKTLFNYMMLADGIDAHTVARITGLPVDELTATRA